MYGRPNLLSTDLKSRNQSPDLLVARLERYILTQIFTGYNENVGKLHNQYGEEMKSNNYIFTMIKIGFETLA